MMMIAQHISKSNEHYTPAEVVEAARAVMGDITLDPASCYEANRAVQAPVYFTQDEDGLSRPWSGRVFLNPPGGLLVPVAGRWVPWVKGMPAKGRRSSAHVWWTKLVAEYVAGNVTQAVFVGFTLEVLRVHQAPAYIGAPVIPVQAFPRCYPSSRLKFSGASPTHANVLVYLPPAPGCYAAFAEAFGPLGFCERGASESHGEAT